MLLDFYLHDFICLFFLSSIMNIIRLDHPSDVTPPFSYRRVKPVAAQLKGKKRNIKRLHKLRHKGKFAMLSRSLDGHIYDKKENRIQLKNERKIKGIRYDKVVNYD